MNDPLGFNTWGYDVIHWIQSWHSDFLDLFFLAITQLGYETAYLVALPLIYWCINRRWGLRLFFLVMLSTGLNEALKNLFQLPRPDAAQVRRLDEISDYGLPSNHGQTGAVVVWGYLAAQVRRTWFTVLASVIALLISLSRPYLGAHFPQDILAGWLLGFLMLGLALRFEAPIARRFASLSLGGQVALVVGMSLLVLSLIPADHLGHYPAETAGTLAGILMGAGLGALWEQHHVRFRVEGPAGQRILRYLAGLIAVGLVYLAGSLIPDLTPWTVDVAVRIMRYLLVGLAAFGLAPWLFVKLRLAQSDLAPR